MHWIEMTEKELKDHMDSLGLQKYRGVQIFEGIHGQKKKLKEIYNVPNKVKDSLEDLNLQLSIEKVYESKLDPTKKILYRLYDGEIVEGVLMEYKHGNSLCVSTQVGCRMGCKFCASTINGKKRDLSAYEMLSQVYESEKFFSTKISNVILMGSGEPLDNYKNVLRFLKLLHEKKGKNMSYRNMTISTCGLVPEILELSRESIPVNLAISLHQTDQSKREELMPIAKKYSIKKLFEALESYGETTSQRITLEYTLIEGENDRDSNIGELRKLTRNVNVLVNIIPLNPTEHFAGKRPNKSNTYRFVKKLMDAGIQATVRRELGSDIEASCGQLKAGYENGIKGVIS